MAERELSVREEALKREREEISAKEKELKKKVRTNRPHTILHDTHAHTTQTTHARTYTLHTQTHTHTHTLRKRF